MFSKLNENEQVLYAEQLKWELWGLYTQYRIIKNTSILKAHLNNLAKTVDYLNKRFSFLKDKFYFLTNLVRDWERSFKI